MKKRAYKTAAMIISGGMLLQFGGCSGGIAEIAAQFVFSTVLRGIIQALLGTGGTTA